MRTKFNLALVIALFIVSLGLPALTYAQERSQDQTPFDSYVRVANKVFVYDQSLFSPYTGPDVSHWERIFAEEPDDPLYNRKRLGIVSLSPTQRAYVDVMLDPMVEHYEFRDVKNSSHIFRLSYYGGFHGALLFNGQGSVYVYASPASLCTQGKETRKFNLKDGKLIEVKQPIVYWDNVTSNVNADSTILLAPSPSSFPVATLLKGTKVQVLTKENNWFLIKTPLGLTGWVPGDRETSPLSNLFNCN